MRTRVLDELAALHNLDDDLKAMLDGQADKAPDVQPDATHGAFDSAHLNDTLDAARTHAGAIDEPFHLVTVNFPAAAPKAVRKIVETASGALGEHADEIRASGHACSSTMASSIHSLANHAIAN